MGLPSHEVIEDNLRFLIKEVQRQIERAQVYLEAPSRKVRKAIVGRDDYIDNLRAFIQRGCFALAAEDDDVEYLKAVDVIAVNLERIADFCESIIDQLDHVSDRRVLSTEQWRPFFSEVEQALAKVEQAVMRRDVHVALSICRVEPRLDAMYAQMFKLGVIALREGFDAQSHVTLLFIWHYFERMGDSLLNIGEAVISAALGEKIKIGQLWALQDSLRDVDPERSIESVQLDPVGESRSGARIARVSSRNADELGDGTAVIFKEGASDKLREEHASIELWERLAPGMVPKALSFHENGVNSAILLEYLPGQTFEQLVLQGRGMRECADALGRVTTAMERVWTQTRQEQAVQSTFVDQLGGRLSDVLSVHPGFELPDAGIGSMNVRGLHQLLQTAASYEASLRAPFSVLIHGDFNVDNVICCPDRSVRFIDLHRSRHGDYVQDVSVFMVSNFRLQIFEAPVRRRINHVILRFHDFAATFAQRQGDKTFAARLALGLARSFATSTRFVLDEAFAMTLFLRARYLLDRVVACAPSELSNFVLPQEVLID